MFNAAGSDRSQNKVRNIAAVEAEFVGFDSSLAVDAELAAAGRQSAGTPAAVENIAGYSHAASPQEESSGIVAAAEHTAVDHSLDSSTVAACHIHTVTEYSQAFADTDLESVRID